MAWRDRIATDPNVMTWKPVVRGTRLAIDFLLELFAAGWTQQAVLESQPQLTEASLRAIFANAAEVMHDEALHRTHTDAA